MVEFRTMYYKPMDRQYHESVTQLPQGSKAEDPIYPITELGETVPEALGGRNIIQTTQAAIRGGAGTLQLVIVPPQDSIGQTSIGARIGKEVREAVKEIAKASNVNIAGVELPTSLRGLSGFDFSQRSFNEELRRKSLEQVKDAIKFAADVGEGGGVDLLSWEFERNISDVKDKNFEDPSEMQIGWVVEKRTGKTIPFRRAEKQWLPVDPKNNFKPTGLNPETGYPELKEVTWNDFEKYNERKNKEKKENKTPEVRWVEERLTASRRQAEGMRSRYLDEIQTRQDEEKQIKENIRVLKERKQEGDIAQQEKMLKLVQNRMNDALQAAQGAQQEIQNLQEQIDNLAPMKEYGLKKSASSYAEAGIIAMREYEEGVKKGTVKKVISVGPEIGWPDYFGSHPDEFKEVIKESRKQMQKLLLDPFARDPVTGEEIKGSDNKPKKNPFYKDGIGEAQAKELAQKHIKGLFDTGHMGMWLAHFKAKPGESEENRIGRFNEWFKTKVKELAEDKDQLIGGIQLVDSNSSAHGHLPPGEGIFPVIDTARIFKKAGFKGFVVSEGHEEERFGQGRIRYKTWQHAGSNMGNGYFGGPPMRWEPHGSGYFGRTYSPLFMFGSYAPGNDFRLWSEVPLE